ncbi:DUF5317 domain-containing protein [Candidatus Frankia alpina]|uniref:DUF5317 domain-containing protein n=1 Tax=Candidatus Frankia alpina TaxID=2699483 RepID=UPI001F306105|nr:DUF5317 domain-containing protein [Candidatus Frankia alpina]
MLTLVCGLGVGLARGGTLGALARVHVLRPWLFVAVILVLAVGGLVPALHSPAWIVAAVLAALFAGMNNRLPGLGLLVTGIIANAAVITVNGGQMPVSLWGAGKAGVPIGDILTSAFHSPAGDGTSLRLLSDIIPLPFPGAPAVVSVGDVAMAAALGLFGAVTPVRAWRTLRARRQAALTGASLAGYGDADGLIGSDDDDHDDLDLDDYEHEPDDHRHADDSFDGRSRDGGAEDGGAVDPADRPAGNVRLVGKVRDDGGERRRTSDEHDVDGDEPGEGGGGHAGRSVTTRRPGLAR